MPDIIATEVVTQAVEESRVRPRNSTATSVRRAERTVALRTLENRAEHRERAAALVPAEDEAS
jgi:hypothetical protein